MANIGSAGQKHVTFEEVKNTEEWKAIRGFWDGTKNKTMERVGVEL